MIGTRTLTAEYRRRTEESKKETEMLLAKEMRYSEDLRKNEYLQSLHTHISHLDNILTTGKY